MFCSGDSDVESSLILQESDLAVLVAPDAVDDDNFLFLPLEGVNCVHTLREGAQIRILHEKLFQKDNLRFVRRDNSNFPFEIFGFIAQKFDQADRFFCFSHIPC